MFAIINNTLPTLLTKSPKKVGKKLLATGHTPKKRYTAKAEANALTFVYVPPTYKRASPIKK